MFTTAPYVISDPAEAQALLESIRLGTLVSSDGGLDASPLPFLFDRRTASAGFLLGHMAKANRQYRQLASGAQVLVTFTGPQCYVSASWYETVPRVSTWYYTAVHVYGRLRWVESTLGLQSILERSFEAFEPQGGAWRPDPSYVDRIRPAIVGLEIEIDRIEAQARLGQENSIADDRAVRQCLSSSGDLERLQVLAEMRRLGPTSA